MCDRTLPHLWWLPPPLVVEAASVYGWLFRGPKYPENLSFERLYLGRSKGAMLLFAGTERETRGVGEGRWPVQATAALSKLMSRQLGNNEPVAG